MNASAINFEDLSELFFRSTSALKGSKLLWEMRIGSIDAEALLSSDPGHRGAKGDETLRESLISLLKFYSLIEIGLVIKLIPEPSYEDFWHETSKNLSFPRFRAFYENDYPLILPQFLLARLEGRLHLYEDRVEEKSLEASSFFLCFIDTVLRARHPDIEYFLRSNVFPGAVPFLIETVEDKEQFMARIIKAPDRRDDMDRFLQGFSRFLVFCEDLDRLLYASRKLPLFQSAMWNYFGDLFQTSGARLAGIVSQAVNRFSGWASEEDSDECGEEIAKYVRDVDDFIQRLTSGFYGLGMTAPLSELAPPLVEA